MIYRKICSTCQLPKLRSDFNKQSRTKDGLQSVCRTCQTKYNQTSSAQLVRLAYKLKTRYGLTLQNYDDMLALQRGVCAICKQPPEVGKRLDIDHDHTCCSGERTCGECIRGLLCRRCNTTLGRVNEDIQILQNMIQYLKD